MLIDCQNGAILNGLDYDYDSFSYDGVFLSSLIG